MNVDIWMPIFGGDFLKKTSHLSAEETGAYIRLELHYWSSGKPLADDDTRLSRVTGQSLKEWLDVREMVSELFEVQDGYWHDIELENERQRAITLKQKRADAGRKGGLASGKARLKLATDNQNSEAAVEAKTNPSPSPSPSSLPSSSPSQPNHLIQEEGLGGGIVDFETGEVVGGEQ